MFDLPSCSLLSNAEIENFHQKCYMFIGSSETIKQSCSSGHDNGSHSGSDFSFGGGGDCHYASHCGSIDFGDGISGGSGGGGGCWCGGGGGCWCGGGGSGGVDGGGSSSSGFGGGGGDVGGGGGGGSGGS